MNLAYPSDSLGLKRAWCCLASESDGCGCSSSMWYRYRLSASGLASSYRKTDRLRLLAVLPEGQTTSLHLLPSYSTGSLKNGCLSARSLLQLLIVQACKRRGGMASSAAGTLRTCWLRLLWLASRASSRSSSSWSYLQQLAFSACSSCASSACLISARAAPSFRKSSTSIPSSTHSPPIFSLYFSACSSISDRWASVLPLAPISKFSVSVRECSCWTMRVLSWESRSRICWYLCSQSCEMGAKVWCWCCPNILHSQQADRRQSEQKQFRAIPCSPHRSTSSLPSSSFPSTAATSPTNRPHCTTVPRRLLRQLGHSGLVRRLVARQSSQQSLEQCGQRVGCRARQQQIWQLSSSYSCTRPSCTFPP